ncbi:hypothetical protein [Oceanicella actignis]|uniref:hypothetical protein n=1 Tax=Oceanicella actignis TaxID=1189325 RepID=UPI0011E83D3B|nr:hypothetical protein [Oceanicella actignis]TYO91562.1 hypothetical protein LY05_00418 [Oceanicella actignis]
MSATLTGLGIGAAFAALFALTTASGLDRLNQGFFTSCGLAALVGACLALDGWVLAGVAGFVAGTAAWAELRRAWAGAFARRRG